MTAAIATRTLGRVTTKKNARPRTRSSHRLARPRLGRRRIVALETIPLVSHLRANGAWDTPRVICSMIFLTAAWIMIQLLTAPAFVVGAPTVIGNKGLATSEIVSAVSSVQGRNIFMLDSGSLLQTVRRLPGVKNAEVRLELPNRVVIAITDQEPQIIWEARGARYLVDGDGVVIKPATGGGRFLLVTDPDSRAEALAPGKQVDKRAIATVQQLDLLLPNQVKSYEWSANVGVSLMMNEGWRAIIGWDDNLNAKLEVLRATSKSVAQAKETLQSVDVRTPERPSVVTVPQAKAPSAATR